MPPEIAEALMVMTRLGTQMGLLWATLGTLACIIIPVGRPRSNRFAWEIRTPTAALIALLAFTVPANTLAASTLAYDILNPPAHTLVILSALALPLACSTREPNTHTVIWTEAVVITMLNQSLGHPAWGLPATAILGAHLAVLLTSRKTPGGLLAGCSPSQNAALTGLDGAAILVMLMTQGP